MGNPSDFPYANPKGWHYTSRERAEGEWTCEQINKIVTYNGCPLGSHMEHPFRGAPLMDWVPYPVHMGPRFAGPIIAFGSKIKVKYRAEDGIRSWSKPETKLLGNRAIL